MKRMKMTKNFSELSTDVLSLIISKLNSPSDLVWFGAVCVNWQYALVQNPDKQLKLSSSLPVLLGRSPFSSGSTDEEHKEKNMLMRLFSLYDGKFHDFPLQITGEICCSSGGWLGIITRAEHNISVKLLNPFSSVNNEIQLPSATNLNFGSKVVLSSCPSSSSSDRRNVVVMAIHSFSGRRMRLSYCRPGDKAWTNMKFEWIKSVENVIYCKGLFYAILKQGVVYSIEVPEANQLYIQPKITVITKNFPLDVEDHYRGRTHFYTDNYLVESSGKILKVMMRKMVSVESSPTVYGIIGFRVFKLAEVEVLVDGDDNNKDKLRWMEDRWVESKNLDGRSLLISYNVSTSFSTWEFPGCRPNCIYFTGDYYKSRVSCSNFVGSPSIGIYDVEDTIFLQRPASSFLYESSCTNSIWIQPTL